MHISKVFMICNAYESGVGHGHQMDGLANPFDSKISPECHEAYEIGYQFGVNSKTKEDENDDTRN